MLKRLPQITLGLVLFFSLTLGLYLRATFAPEWYQPTRDTKVFRPWQAEADCYSRMYRVKRILEGKGLIQSFHPHENWPIGLTPSTTAPLDYCILALYFPLKPFSPYALDWAGAIVSPAMWVAMVLFWAFAPLKEWVLTSRIILIVGTACLPQVVWATGFGRPDHQSLILALFAFVFTAEYERWSAEGRARAWWNIAAGAGWGLAMWTSLFEPLILMLLLVAFNLMVRWTESARFLISMGTVMLVALALEGVHIYVPPPEYRQSLESWGSSIAELRPYDHRVLIQVMGYIVLFVPYVAGLLVIREHEERHTTDWFLVFLTVALTVVTVYQSRWIYYSCLAELLLIGRWMAVEKRWILVSMCLWIFACCMGATIYNGLSEDRSARYNQPSAEMEILAQSIDKPGGILAPWWLSAGIGYFSDQPVVTCSSHCDIAGIVDAAHYYTSKSWAVGDKILKARQVRWVVIYDDPRLDYPILSEELTILGKLPLMHLPDGEENPDAKLTLCQQLIGIETVPPRYQLRAATTHLRLYEYTPTF